MHNTVVIDVRTEEEYNKGHREGALHFDVRHLGSGQFPDLPHDVPIEVYCASGARSALAKTLLEANGFTNVTNIGGYSG